jgi:hypothetical protein
MQWVVVVHDYNSDVVLKGNDLYLSFTRTQERNQPYDNELLHWHNRYDITISKAKIELASGGGIELRWNGADKKTI